MAEALRTALVNGQSAETGCWVDGHWGHYAGMRSVDIAIEFGWDDAQAAQATMEYNDRGDDPEWGLFDVWPDIVDDAELWLNEHTDDEHFWEWRDGELFLSTLSPWHHGDVRPDRVIAAVEAETFWQDPDQDRVSWVREAEEGEDR